MKLVCSPEPLMLAQEKLNEILLELNGLPILLMLSGGSSLSILDNINSKNLSSNITVTVLDERYSMDPAVNNFAQIERTKFFSDAIEKGCNFINTKVMENESIDGLSNRFELKLNEWLEKNPNGKIVATVGIGDDGHIAGMMSYPNEIKFFDKLFNDGNHNNIVTAYNAEHRNEYPMRITSNMNMLRRIDFAVIFAQGEKNKAALINLFSNEGTLASTPAKIIREMEGEVVLFTDQNVTI